MNTLWYKFKTGEYGDGCGQYKDSRRRRKSNLNSYLLKCTCGCIIFFCLSLLLSLVANFQLNFKTLVVALYFVGAFAFLTALCLGAIVLSLSRVWNEVKYERLKSWTYTDRSQMFYDYKYGGRTMEEFSRCVAEKLLLLQNTKKDS